MVKMSRQTAHTRSSSSSQIRVFTATLTSILRIPALITKCFFFILEQIEKNVQNLRTFTVSTELAVCIYFTHLLSGI